MLKCASCGVEGADEALFCASCGAPLSGETLVTEGAEAPSPTPARIPSAPKPRSGSSSSSTNEGRFLPGALVAGRYRIVALLGKGGMGEVYRADDLTLGQQVALKFLREATAKDEALLERFRNEVRTARRVSHPNVCRVYDVSETDDQLRPICLTQPYRGSEFVLLRFGRFRRNFPDSRDVPPFRTDSSIWRSTACRCGAAWTVASVISAAWEMPTQSEILPHLSEATVALI